MQNTAEMFFSEPQAQKKHLISNTSPTYIELNKMVMEKIDPLKVNFYENVHKDVVLRLRNSCWFNDLEDPLF